MSTTLPAVIGPVEAAIVAQADTDRQFVAMWIARHESPNTRRNYARQASRLLAFVDKPLGEVRVGDVQAYLATLADLAPASRANATAAIKSLFSFAQELGFVQFNAGKAIKAPAVKNTLAERIMGEGDAMRLIALEPDRRNRAILTMLYAGGLRISELCDLAWRDLTSRDGAGQATVFGKGGKTRAILLSASTWAVLMAIKGEAAGDAPVFRSRKGAPHRQGRGGSGWALDRRVGALATPRPCVPQPRSWGTDPSRAGHARPCVSCHHGAVSSRPAD